MSKHLTNKDYEIIEEYFCNGYDKSKAFAKYNPKEKYKSSGAFYNSVYSFFKREGVKEFINQRMESTIGEREELINELLNELKFNVFCKDTNELYTYSHKQKDIELLMKVSGINKAPKYKEDIEQENNEIEINVGFVNENGVFVPELEGLNVKAKMTSNSIVFDESDLED